MLKNNKNNHNSKTTSSTTIAIAKHKAQSSNIKG